MNLRCLLLAASALCASPAAAQSLATVDRNGSMVSIEAYGPNIVHVPIALAKKEIAPGPGYGIRATAPPAGW